MGKPESVVVDGMTKSKRRPYRFILFLLIVALLIPTGRYALEWWYPLKYEDTVTKVAEEFDLDPSLVYAVIHTESKFDPEALSSANAKGLMQITDDTYFWALRRAGEEASTHDPDDLFVAETNIRTGCYILVLLSEKFDSMETVLAAYNAGQGRVQEWLDNPDYSKDGVTLEHIPYEETAEYIRRVLTAQKRYQQLYNIP